MNELPEIKKETSKETSEEIISFFGKPLLFGGIGLLVFILVVIIWGIAAPISSGSVAPGSINLFLYKKTIQHLEGGIIEKIQIKEGDYVEKGQVLIHLNETSARANLNVLEKQYWALKASTLRLLAERDSKRLQFESFTTKNPVIQKIIKSEAKLYKTRRQLLRGRISVLEQKIAQLHEESHGLEAQQNAVAEQLRTLKTDKESYEKLYNKGYVSNERFNEIKRQESGLIGSKGELNAQIAKVSQTITETKLKIVNIKDDQLRQTMREYQETQKELSNIEEQLVAAKDALTRLTIKAPQSGRVNNLQYHTIGGIISPATPILDIIPQNDKLIIDARVPLQDIDVVHPNLEARVRLSAFSGQKIPTLTGTVLTVSAESIIDQNTGLAFYLAKIEITDPKLQTLEDIKLYPGMPVDVLILTGTRNFWSYLFAPIKDTLRVAFRES